MEIHKFDDKTNEALLAKLNAWDACYTDWDPDEFVQTQETIEMFKDGAYHWSNKIPSDQGNGVYILQEHQFYKGDTRGDLIIVDLGDHRYARKFD